MHPEALGLRQLEVLKRCGPLLSRRKFLLGGGTAVALHLGHRRSVDLDWFTLEAMGDPLVLAAQLKEAGLPLRVTSISGGTLHGTVLGVRVTLLEYPYPLVGKPAPWRACGAGLLSLDDLCCMKLSAIAQRGAKKDFVDFHALHVHHAPLRRMLDLYRRKYKVADINAVLYGLAFFDDADRERAPRLLWPIKWNQIKTDIQGWLTRPSF